MFTTIKKVVKSEDFKQTMKALVISVGVGVTTALVIQGGQYLAGKAIDSVFNKEVPTDEMTIE